ncbi:hypothetical protein FJZ19_02595 [Candidatus Pacearchaeota archaeon]|nr:hypothetical protein [Candidatus Pacearchaeota archaeon]
MTRIEVMAYDSIDFSKKGPASKRPIKVFNIKDTLSREEAERAKAILADPIVDVASVDLPILSSLPEESSVIEQSPKPGVTDPEGVEARKILSRALGREIGPVQSSSQYLWIGELEGDDYVRATKQLGNPLINEFRRVKSSEWDATRGVGFHFPDVNLPKPEPFTYILTDDGVSLHQRATDDELLKISDDRLLALNLEEMLTIKHLFENPDFIEKRKEKGLEATPTDAEVEALGQTWSEHCIHKKLTGKWVYTSDDKDDKSGLPEITNNVLKSVIQVPARVLAGKVDWLVSIFEDNSGVIKLNDNWNIAHKVETHNHPSALDGFGGADTGTGGVIRDPGSTGKGMTPVSSQFSFRKPHPCSYPYLPLDIQSAARMFQTVTEGVEDYGNKFGIPTMCGSVLIDPVPGREKEGSGWLKPGVVVGCVAVAPAQVNEELTHTKDIRPGYIAISLGGRVGKDGIHGATGSSGSLSAEAEKSQLMNQSVQIGNPITEKNVFEAMYALLQKGYIRATQDCGAGGWNSAISELGALLNELEEARYQIKTEFARRGITKNNNLEEKLAAATQISGLEQLNMPVASPFYDTLKCEIDSGEIFDYESTGKGGVDMDLTHAPEKYPGLAGWEKLVSEAQEREIIVIKPEHLPQVLEICEHLNVEATPIAVFNDTGYYEVKDQDRTITFLPMTFLHRGLPQMTIQARYTPCQNKEPELPEQDDLTGTLLELLGAPNMQSYEWIFTKYDHEVRGGSLIKPIVGKGRGKSDAIAYRPVLGEKEVVIETQGSNPWQGDIDAYEMGKNSVIDAVGRVIAAGGNLEKIVFNGNTLCPPPEKNPEIAAKVIRMLKGGADAQLALENATISGKDSTSMKRQYKSTLTSEIVSVQGKTELVMSALAVAEDDSTLVTPDFKLPGDLVYIVGETRDELGASEYYLLHNQTGRNVPTANLPEIKKRYQTLSSAIKAGFVHSCQYLGKGGLAAAISNCAIAGDLGAVININSIDNNLGRADKILFSETTGRFVVSVSRDKQAEFEEYMKGYATKIGEVGESKVCVRYKGKNVVLTQVNDLRESNKGEIKL